MNNKLSEIRRKIRLLRDDMLALEEAIRHQVNHDQDCSEASGRLMGMSRNLIGLIRIRDAMGGGERMLNVDERLKQHYVQKSRNPLKGVIARR